MINAFIQPNIIEGTPSFIHRKYSASHELFHIMYQELILKKNNQNRIIWFDEGMAQFFSGEKNKEMTLDFSNWLSMTKSNTKKIPNLNTLNHCSDFETKDYDGYNLSLLAIKYLYDKLGIDELKKMLSNNNMIIELGNVIVQDAFNYYENKYVKNRLIENYLKYY